MRHGDRKQGDGLLSRVTASAVQTSSLASRMPETRAYGPVRGALRNVAPLVLLQLIGPETRLDDAELNACHAVGG